MIIDFSYKEKEIYQNHSKRIGKIRWNTHIGVREESNYHWEDERTPLYKNYKFTIVERQIFNGKDYLLLKSVETFNGQHCFIVVQKKGIKL